MLHNAKVPTMFRAAIIPTRHPPSVALQICRPWPAPLVVVVVAQAEPVMAGFLFGCLLQAAVLGLGGEREGGQGQLCYGLELFDDHGCIYLG